MALFRKAQKVFGALAGDEDMEALLKWQQKLEEALRYFGPELDAMRVREDQYAGTREIIPGVNSRKKVAKSASNIRNITYELIESEVDSSIPSARVAPLHPWSEERARGIESMLRAQMDRLPMEYHNDEQERTCAIQGGSVFLVEWDNSRRTHTTMGDVTVQLLHPKQVIPQPGVTSLQKCDYVFVQLAQTKEYIQRRYGVDVDQETEERPDVGVGGLPSSGSTPGLAGAFGPCSPMQPDTKVTQNIVFYRNADGGIGKFSWVNDVPLEFFDDYQARHLEVCAKCGAQREHDGQRRCPQCNGTNWEYRRSDGEPLTADVTLSDGTVIPRETVLPYYRPNAYPLVLRKNVSVFGHFLGASDVDKIRDQQEFIKKLGTKIEEKLLKGGSFVTKPKDVSISMTDEELKVLQVRSVQEAEMIKTITVQPNIAYDSMEMDKAYDHARSTLGITESFQGKPDRTATSGIAKQIAVAQSAGRLESKRRMKNAAYADLYELLFKFMLAYCDEPRAFMTRGVDGKPVFGAFNRYDFLEQDAAGEWYYNDAYLFSVDSSSALANNREAMWQETRMNLQTGAYGPPSDPQTRLFFWMTMERLHYPGASETRAQMERLVAQQDAQAQMQQQATMQQPPALPGGIPPGGGAPPPAGGGAPAPAPTPAPNGPPVPPSVMR